MSRLFPVLQCLLLAALSAFLLPNCLHAQKVRPVSSIKPSRSKPHALDPAIRLVRDSLTHVQDNVVDYTALFVKRSRVNHKLQELQFADLKIRHDRYVNDGDATIRTPMSVYLGYVKPSSRKGREVIWVDGKNDGKLIAHDEGMIGAVTVELDPKGYLAMRGERHSVTDIGIENLLKKILETLERDRQHGESEVQFFRNAKVGDVACTMVEVTHPTARPIFSFHRARIYFDDSLKMPIRFEAWSRPRTPGGEPVLEEEYNYLKVAVNVGLTDRDFDPNNSNYRFR